MTVSRPGFLGLGAKTVVVHTTTYILMGLLASSLLNYAAWFARPEMACWMRQTTDPMVMAGPLFQPIRGVLFALAFYPLRDVLFGTKRGWLVMWLVLVVVGILSTFGPAPGSVEGLLYTLIPIADQLTGLVEVVAQALWLSIVLCYWVNHPNKRWLSPVLAAAFFVLVSFQILGLLVR
jgi:hypothetical protein